MKLTVAFDMLKILINNDRVPASTLSARLNVSTRSIMRYADELTCAGIPLNIYRGCNGGIELDEQYKRRSYNYFPIERYTKRRRARRRFC